MINLLYLYLLMPFIFAILLIIPSFIKTNKTIRGMVKFIATIEFLLSFAILILTSNSIYNLLGVKIIVDDFSLYFSLITSFLFLLFSFFSKKFILKLNRLFYTTSLFLFGIVNLSLFLDNIICLISIVFLFFIISYFLNYSFSKQLNKNLISKQLKADIVWFSLALFLILKDFIRYFLVNDIEFSFSNLSLNLYHIKDDAVLLAFIGFLILIFRLYNLIPFSSKNLSITKYINPFVNVFLTNASIILASKLFIKIYLNFDYLFYQIQTVLIFILLCNLFVYVFLSIGEKRLFKYLYTVFVSYLIIGLFSTFSFQDECYSLFLYFILVLLLSYNLLAFTFMLLWKRFKTDDTQEFKKIVDNSKIPQIFISIPILNLAIVPMLPIFNVVLISLMMLFSVDYENEFLNLTPYLTVISVILLSFSAFSMLYKILIDPSDRYTKQFEILDYQKIILLILIIFLVALSFCTQHIIDIFEFASNMSEI